MITARGQVLAERGQIFHFHVNREDQTAVGRVRMLVLIQKVDNLVRHQFINLFVHHAEVGDSVCSESGQLSFVNKTLIFLTTALKLKLFQLTLQIGDDND